MGSDWARGLLSLPGLWALCALPSDSFFVSAAMRSLRFRAVTVSCWILSSRLLWPPDSVAALVASGALLLPLSSAVSSPDGLGTEKWDPRLLSASAEG